MTFSLDYRTIVQRFPVARIPTVEFRARVGVPGYALSTSRLAGLEIETGIEAGAGRDQEQEQVQKYRIGDR